MNDASDFDQPRLGPRAIVAGELLRALAEAALLPVRLLDFAACRDALRRELSALLTKPARITPTPAPRAPSRPLRVFVSCAEASGELHAVHFVAALRRELDALNAAPAELTGLGGAALARAGVRTLGDPVARATMGFDGVLETLPYYLRLLTTCARHFREQRPDVCVLVDSPALHVPLGRIARRHGVRVAHFVTPQHWAWAPWRASSYPSAVDLALTILPFEPAWFARRGVRAVHVGHPLLDPLASVPPSRPSPASRRLVILPGSRERVIERNLPWMLDIAARLRERRPELEALVVHEDTRREAQLAEFIAAADASSWCAVRTGALHESLSSARVALSVSGTVLLDLLHHRTPTVVIYRVESARDVWMYRNLLATPYFASLNLLAGREVAPEFCFRGAGPREAVLDALERCWGDAAARREIARGLDLAAERLGPAGACARAARHVLSLCP